MPRRDSDFYFYDMKLGFHLGISHFQGTPIYAQVGSWGSPCCCVALQPAEIQLCLSLVKVYSNEEKLSEDYF